MAEIEIGEDSPVSPIIVNKLITSFLVSSSDKNLSDDHTYISLPPKSPTQPRDKDEFLKRVSTFTVFKWPAKPEEASPVVCARYGWENTAIDLLKCISCKNVLYGKLPEQNKCDLYKEACSRLCESIKTAHHKFCPWPTTPCPDSFIEIWSWNKEQVWHEFLERIQSFSRTEDFHFQIEDSSSDQIKAVFDTLCALCMKESIPLRFKETQLALRGWRRSTETSPILVCNYCMRQVGLWNFEKSLSSTESTVNSTNNKEKDDNFEPPLKKAKPSCVKAAFNPLSEHRLWCAWIKPLKTDLNKKTTCWEIHLQKLLKIGASSDEHKGGGDQTSYSTLPTHLQKIRALRKTLANWSSKKLPNKEKEN